MTIDRRRLIAAGATTSLVPWALAGCAPNTDTGADTDTDRKGASELRGIVPEEDFPVASALTYLNSAGQHPLPRPVYDAMKTHLDYQALGPGDGRAYFSRKDQAALKTEFGQMINATPNELAFVQSTSDGENIIISGMDLARRGGNVVLDDLHFTSSIYLYKKLEAQGLELRILKNKDGVIPVEDIARAMDSETRLISLALVSNINGYLHDVKAISSLAHERGAYVYADIIQAAGAVPLDMAAMGIDFAAASTYKWLMAERGFGLLYARKDLQDTVAPTTRWGHRQVSSFNRDEMTWDEVTGAARYETGNISEPLAAATLAGVRYINNLGVDRIAAHAATLTSKLQVELPRLGFAALTPPDMGTPIVAFHVNDPDTTRQKLRDANISATVAAADQRMRISVSVFNTQDDVDRLLEALA